MGSMALSADFWSGRRVFVTGHTGFKGSWLSIWLSQMGAIVTGYSLDPITRPNLFDLAGIADLIDADIRADIRDTDRLLAAIKLAQPSLVLHLAAQSTVLEGYANPASTFDVNVMGTVNLLEAVRQVEGIQATLIITTDKCYENEINSHAHSEGDPLGGADPYSASKAAAELVTAAYRQSFFATSDNRIASVRAGNVIGGGDWTANRLLPDCIRAFTAGQPASLRNPASIRPWQYVLDPLHGYLQLAERLSGPVGTQFAGAWNFAPNAETDHPVIEIARAAASGWGSGAEVIAEARPDFPHESAILRLDATKASTQLRWALHWPPLISAENTGKWHKRLHRGESALALCQEQLADFLAADSRV